MALFRRTISNWLVVWNHIYILGIIIPIDYCFSEGLKPPTSQKSPYFGECITMICPDYHGQNHDLEHYHYDRRDDSLKRQNDVCV